MYGVSKITVTEEVALITINKVSANLNLLADVLKSFSDAEINIDMISQSAPQGNNVNYSFSVSSEDIVNVLSICNNLKQRYGSIKPMVISGNCKIQLYGEEMREMHGVAARAISAIADTGIELTLVTTSEVDISLLVTNSHISDAVAALEKAFNIKA